MSSPYVPNLFPPQPYAGTYPAISAALVAILDNLLTANGTPAFVYDHMPLVRSNPLADEWRAAFMPEISRIHFWCLIVESTPLDKINILREEDVARRSSAKLFGYYGYQDPGPERSDLELSLPQWEKIVRLVLTRLQTGDPATGSRTLINPNDPNIPPTPTCLTYKSPESVSYEMAQFSTQLTTHMVSIPLTFEEAYLWAQ